MRDDIKTYVDAKVNYFEQYFTIPESAQEEFQQFADAVNALGESCSDAMDFESRYMSEGLMDKFTALITKCQPKAVQISQADQAYADQIAAEMKKEFKRDSAKHAAKGVLDTIRIEAESEFRRRRREEMIEAGTFDEWNRTTNKIDDAGRVLQGLGRLLKK